MSYPIPETSDAITPDWLTASLRASGNIGLPSVTSATLSRMGEDQAFSGGALYRVNLTYDPPDAAAPASVVIKLSPTDPHNRAVMQKANSREVNFYRTIAKTKDFPSPRCYHAEFDAKTGASVLLLQDLGCHRSVPFITGCGPTDAKRVIEALAAFHAKCWNSPTLADLSGASILSAFPFDAVWPHYVDKVKALLPDTDLPDEFLKLGDFVTQNQTQIFKNLMENAPITCLHRDIQADNVMFGPAQGKAAPIFLDWQFAGKGRGVYDVAYFLISSVAPSLRRNMERNLVAHYHAELLRGGVVGYSFAECWTDYLQSVAGKLFLTIAATVLLDNSSSHKTAWRRTDLQRLLAFCKDHSISARTFPEAAD